MRKFLTAAVMCGTALSPVLATGALAFTVGTATVADPSPAAASAATLAAMQTQCNALAAAHDTDGIGGDNWSADVVIGAVSLTGGPTETGARSKTNVTGTGTYTPGSTYIQGNPFRIGGSVNMFGDQYATAGRWSDSTYDFTADYTTTYTHEFSCDIVLEKYHPEEFVPAEGAYVVNGDFGESEDAVRGNCAAYTAQGFPLETRPTWWGVEIYRGGNVNPLSPGYRPHCRFEGTQAHTNPAYYDPEAVVGNEAGVAVPQTQVDNLSGHEDHGGPVNAVGGPFHIGQVVICISPKKLPGIWTQQNGYTGDKCNADWFQSKGIYLGAGAVWGSGTEGSNGTYISVPNYTY